MQALITSGLLGYTKEGMLFRHCVEDFQRYGTQWNEALGERSAHHVYNNLPMIEGEAQPVGTTIQVRIAPGNGSLSRSEKDTGWIAQFYIKPNSFFFLDSTVSTLVSPIGIRISSRQQIPGMPKPTYLCPDPQGALAMIMILGQLSGSAEKAFPTAYDIAAPLFDELSFTYDQPLPIAHVVLIGIPSGTIYLSFPKPPPIGSIEPGSIILPKCPFPELEDATSLYREAISSNNPFH